MTASRILLIFSMGFSSAIFASEGLWNRHDLKQGLDLAGWQMNSKSAAVSRLSDEGPAVVRFRKCTGAFVSRSGLMMTAYDCAIPTLVRHSRNGRNLIREGFYAGNRQNELPTDMDFSASVTLESQDVTAQVLDGYQGRTVSRETYARFQERKEKIIASCEQDSKLKCRIAELSGATRFLLQKTVPLPDFRLVYAPPFAAGNPQNKAMGRQGDIPEAAFAIFRSYGGFGSRASIPTRPPKYFPIRTSKLEPGEPLYIPSYAWRYKRHLGAAVMHQAIAGGLYAALSTGFASAIRQAVAEEAGSNAALRNLYIQKIQGQIWQEENIDREIASVGASEALNELRLQEKNLMEFVNTHWTEQERKILLDRIEYYKKDGETGAKTLPISRLLESEIISFLSWAEREGKVLTRVKEREFERAFQERRARFDPSVEARILSYTMEMAKKENARTRLEIPADLLAWLEKEEPTRTKDLTSLIAQSRVLEVSSFTNKMDLSQDGLVKLRNQITGLLDKFPWDSDADVLPFEYAYNKALKEYSSAKNLPYYEGEEADIITWAFGDVRILQNGKVKLGSKSIVTENFISDADIGIRRCIGAPSLDATGRLIGVYTTLDEDRELFVDWYYNKKRTSAMHIGISTIRNSLKAAGAKTLLDELRL